MFENKLVCALLVVLVIVVIALLAVCAAASVVSAVKAENMYDIAASGFLAEESDSRSKLASSLAGGRALGEHLVPGNATWPNPTESNERRVDFAASPCEAAATYNQMANTNSLSTNGRNAGLAWSKSEADQSSANRSTYLKALAEKRLTPASKEHLSALWKTTKYSSGAAGDAREARLPAEHASDYRVGFDPMRNRMAADDPYAREQFSGLEDALIGM